MPSTFYFSGNTYTLNRLKNGGQYAGPCPWSGGRDRFIVEPVTGNWMCRQCVGSCAHGKQSPKGAYRFGNLSEIDGNIKVRDPVIQKRRRMINRLDDVPKLQEGITPRIVEYLHSRGVTDETIRTFRLGGYSGRAVTIPLLYTLNDQPFCQAIKRRWLPEFQGNKPPYQVLKDHNPVGIFNRDVIESATEYLVIANSLFDAMLLHQMGFKVIAPFVGEASWNVEWSKLIVSSTIVNLQDTDPINPRTGKAPGREHALSRAMKLASNPTIKRIITAYPPDGSTDINEMYVNGSAVAEWMWQTINYRKGEQNG